MSRQIFKATAIVSGMTFFSRILGFVRDMLIAQIFGADSGTDAFFVAFKIPNFFRRLFAEGAFAQAFVPVLSDFERQGSQKELRNFIDRAGGTLAVILMLMSIIGVLAAPMLIMAFAPGLVQAGKQFNLSVEMLQITMPYLFFIVSVAFAGSILNACGRFAIPAVTPVLLNVCMIVAALWLAPLMTEPILALAWGILIAGVVQLLFQFPALINLGLLPRLRLGLGDPQIMQPLKMMGPAVFAVSVTQINLLLDTFMASFLETGSISWLYYSDRLVEFPLGILGVALATVILPKLSGDHIKDDVAAFSRALDMGLRTVFLLGAPASVGLMLLAEPVLFALFQYDEFTSADVGNAGRSLMAYASGLLGFMLIKVLATGFSARKDLTTPVRFGGYALLTNLSLNLLLIIPLAHAGLALATSLAAFVNAGLLLRKLLKDRIYRPGPGWFGFVLKVILANAVMALMLYFIVEPSNLQAWQSADRAINLTLFIALGGAIYLGMLILLRLKPRHLLM